MLTDVVRVLADPTSPPEALRIAGSVSTPAERRQALRLIEGALASEHDRLRSIEHRIAELTS